MSDGGLFGLPLTQTLNTATMTGTAGTVVQVIAVAIGVLIIVVVIDSFYPFLPMNPMGTGPSAAVRAGKLFWTTIDADAQNLIVPAAQSPTTLPAQYSMSVQLIVGDSRTPDTQRYRHILHRGSNPCGLSAKTAGPTGHAGIQSSDIATLETKEPVYTTEGLPQIMNPGVFLDKYKNDIHIFVHTEGVEDGTHALWLESMTIEDVPLNTPITLGIICNGKVLEVYWNCRLYSTLLLRGTPYLPKADNQWFGRYCAYPMSGLVKHLQLWPTALNLGDYMRACSTATAPKFPAIDMPAACPTAPKQPQKAAGGQ